MVSFQNIRRDLLGRAVSTQDIPVFNPIMVPCRDDDNPFYDFTPSLDDPGVFLSESSIRSGWKTNLVEVLKVIRRLIPEAKTMADFKIPAGTELLLLLGSAPRQAPFRWARSNAVSMG